ncbi:MAG: hypothetical protein HY711_00650, partial [Candidatus Melainabacteria bacterium]|nr:hypothetical protein [Candidatus Melainabacteria bacterium]
MSGSKYFDAPIDDGLEGFVLAEKGTYGLLAGQLSDQWSQDTSRADWVNLAAMSSERFMDNGTLPYLRFAGAFDVDDDNDMAGRIHGNLNELSQWVFGRAAKEIEKDILDSLAIMNSQQIAAVDRAYRQRFGNGIADALKDSRHLSEFTRKSSEIYLKGADKLSDDDVLNLADIALKSSNADLFQQVFTGASKEVRQKFLNGGGHVLINTAFQAKTAHDCYGSGVLMSVFSSKTQVSQDELNHLHEIVETGKISTTTQIRDNTSFFGDSEKGIEFALFTMDDADRQLFFRGRELVLEQSNTTWSDSDRQAVEHYNGLHAALVSAGNETEVARWEDMIAVQGGSLVSKLWQHKGIVFDDNVHDVLSTVESMSEKDWQYLRDQPAYRKQIDSVLSQILNPKETELVLSLLDKKISAPNFGQSRNIVRSVMDKIDVNTHTGLLWLNNNEQNIIEAIQEMSLDEQKAYRENPEFRKQLEQKVADRLDEGAERQTAIELLKQIDQSVLPRVDIVAKLKLIAAERHEKDITETLGAVAAAPMTMFASLGFVVDKYLLDSAVRNSVGGTNSRYVIAIVEQAFKDNPWLHERISLPKTAEDNQLLESFKDALKGALGELQFAKYGMHLIDQAYVPIELKVDLHRGVLDDDEFGLYQEMTTVSEEERRKLLTDDLADKHAHALQETVFAGFGAEERKVALHVLRQGKMNPEDKMRAYMLGAGTCEDEIKDLLRALNPAGIELMQSAYAKKYGGNLTADLFAELGGRDLTEIKRLLRRGSGGVLDDFNAVRDEYYESRAGVGADLVDEFWDGTGFQSDQAHRQQVKTLAEAARNFAGVSPAVQANLVETYLRALDNFTESKGALADVAADLGITGVALAGAYFSGGTSLALLSKLSLVGKVGVAGTLGALFKVGTKAAIMGSDYDLSYV